MHVSDETLGALGAAIPIVAIVVWAAYAAISVVMKSRVRELEVRERIAMIERGIVPPSPDPHLSGTAFPDPKTAGRAQYRAYKFRSAGVTMIAVGFGLMVMMFPNFRVGGFLVVVGIGFIVSAVLERSTGR
jgi:hypothetical protein